MYFPILIFYKDFQDGELSLPLLFPCSSLKMDTLPRTLKEHNICIDIVTAYVTVPHPQLRESVIQLANEVSLVKKNYHFLL